MFLFNKNNIKFLTVIFLLFIFFVYILNIDSIPDKIVLIENTEPNLRKMIGVNITENSQVIEASTKYGKTEGLLDEDTQKKKINMQKDYNVSLLGINIKKVKADIVKDRKIIPLGNLVGIKLYTDGILVVGLNEVKGEDNQTYKPFEMSGIKLGDSITKIDDVKVKSTDELLECLHKNNGEKVKITFKKDEKEEETEIMPVKTGNGTYKLGLWVRDAAAGIGTLSFYDKLTNSIASLGHGIQDVDTGEMVDISSGEFTRSYITSIQKGENKKPGRIEGNIDEDKDIGIIYNNTKFGVFGHVADKDIIDMNYNYEMDIAFRNEIKEGNAKILSTLENGKTEEYEVNIQKIFKNNNENNKSMIIKITDKRLIERTGGIIQGMSGSPIIQNGKFVGALTHVLVSDPTTGYGVFADLMVKELK